MQASWVNLIMDYLDYMTKGSNNFCIDIEKLNSFSVSLIWDNCYRSRNCRMYESAFWVPHFFTWPGTHFHPMCEGMNFKSSYPEIRTDGQLCPPQAEVNTGPVSDRMRTRLNVLWFSQHIHKRARVFPKAQTKQQLTNSGRKTSISEPRFDPNQINPLVLNTKQDSSWSNRGQLIFLVLFSRAASEWGSM